MSTPTPVTMSVSSPPLPSDLLYPIFALIPTRTLLTLAHTSRTTRHPAESLLYRSVTLVSRRRVKEFCESVVRCAELEGDVGRLGPLVREMCLGRRKEDREPGEVDENPDESYESWHTHYAAMHAALSHMPHLTRLTVHHGLNERLGWVLLGTSTHLQSLTCGFVLDREFLAYLAGDEARELEDLDWYGCAYVGVCEGEGAEVEAGRESEKEEAEVKSGKTSATLASDANDNPYPYTSCPTTTLLLSHIPRTALPRITSLHSTSFPLARALVPGRPVKHLWVPGLDAGVDVVNGVGLERFWNGGVGRERLRREVVEGNGYGRVSVRVGSVEEVRWEESERVVGEGEEDKMNATLTPKRRTRYPRRPPSPPTRTSPPTETHLTSHLLSALHDLSLSTGPLLSLRMTLNFSPLNAGSVSGVLGGGLNASGAGFGLGLRSPPAVRAVFECIAREMGELRSLGFVDMRGGELGGWGGLESPTHPILTPLSSLAQLHTLALWAVLSPEDMRVIERRCSKSLKTVACLGFASGWEYLCVPVNVINREDDMGGACGDGPGGEWEKEWWDEERREVERRKRMGSPYALRDLGERLWRDVDVSE